ncbi:MAG: IS110 family transposase [Gammaproteobacteria bacterium]
MMSLYQNFIGIDIGKFTFVAAQHGRKETFEYQYDCNGIQKFLQKFDHLLPTAFIVLEATGGYERDLLTTLCVKQFVVHRANTRKVKNFVRSHGNSAKTDALDAKALAFYGSERHKLLERFQPVSQNQSDLYALVNRRGDLKRMLTAEKNRAQAPVKNTFTVNSCLTVIKTLEEQVELLNQQIKIIISGDKVLKARKRALKTVPGIGNIVAEELLATMPELGSLTREQAASLAGVAPRANDSGKHQGYRRVAPGRNVLKPMLFLAAMAAGHSKSAIGTFYMGLVARGKKKMVALTAVMRKIIVIANARLKELTNTEPTKFLVDKSF